MSPSTWANGSRARASPGLATSCPPSPRKSRRGSSRFSTPCHRDGPWPLSKREQPHRQSPPRNRGVSSWPEGHSGRRVASSGGSCPETIAVIRKIVVPTRRLTAIFPKRSTVAESTDLRAVFNRLDAEPGAAQRHSKNPPVSPLRKGGKKTRRRRLSPPCEGGSPDFPPLAKGG